jgi:NTE family protein
LRRSKWLPGLVVLTLVVGCACPAANPVLSRFDSEQGYRFSNLSSPGNSDSLFVILTFSGGGTRAAALSYGVMEQLRDTQIRVNGETRRLLDEVDVISSVSGGSFTAAYYAAYGDGLFRTFKDRFLRRNFHAALITRMLAPWNWVRLASRTFSRIDLAAECYDRDVFDHKTFGDLVAMGRRPFIILNATDMTLGLPFQFTQDQFDLLYSDLSEVPIARGVAASSAFPVLFSPITLVNHEKGADFVEPEWVALGLEDRDLSSRRYQKALQAHSYVAVSDRPYIHLLDGGVADNLGVRAALHSLSTTDSAWSVLRMMNLEKVDRVVVITVNARTDPDTTWDKHAAAPGPIDVAGAAISGLMNNYTFESAALLRERFEQFAQDAEARKACEDLLRERGCADTSVPGGPLHEVAFHAIEVSFDRIDDEAKRRYFQELPTTLTLPDETVDRLIQVGADILAGSEQFHELLAALAEEPAA